MGDHARAHVTNDLPIEELFGYSTGMRVGDLVYVAGQLARDAQGNQIAAEDLPSKVGQVAANVASVLRRFDRSIEDILYLQVHVTRDVSDLGELGPLLREHFGHVAPAATIVPVDAVNDPGGLLEISAVATA
jgi:2-iminobutanoate/2-iminopropanoate deaminase